MTKAKKKAKERERDALVDNHAKVISLLGRVLPKNVASSEDEDVVPPLEYASSEDEAETIAEGSTGPICSTGEPRECVAT